MGKRPSCEVNQPHHFFLSFRQAHNCILQCIYKILHLSFVRRCILKLYQNIVDMTSWLRKLDTDRTQNQRKRAMTVLNMLSSYLFCRSHYNHGFTLSIGKSCPVHFTCFCFNRNIWLK
jgi:hypothetical protein